MKYLIPLFFLFAIACKQNKNENIPVWNTYNELEEIKESLSHDSPKMHFKLIQSRVLDKNKMIKNICNQLGDFTEEDYQNIKPLIFNQDILTIQSNIQAERLSYEILTKWYLYRILKYEIDSTKYLNAIISINPDAVKEAKIRDKKKSIKKHLLYGIPVLLKDNINFTKLPTTAGAYVLKNNIASDAYIVNKLEEKGAIILGKTNLSEWANFLFFGGPNGFSSIGGQTLNPYSRKIFDTGGSSSGSGVAIAANYATVAVGTETSGSILSPSSSNSIVGLKPTVGLLSRSGIVPLSSTFDTPGPMTRNVLDNAILLSAMLGEDPNDSITLNKYQNIEYWKEIDNLDLKGLKFGVIKEFLDDSLYNNAIKKLEELGGIIIEFEPEEVNFNGFMSILNLDMKKDLPNYCRTYCPDELKSLTIESIIDFNKKDTLIRIPYGQGIFEAILLDTLNSSQLDQIKERLHKEGKDYFDKPTNKYNLDAILSINNWSAGYAAIAKYPCLTIPMGYTKLGEPFGLTIIAKPYEEEKLLKIGFAYEKATKHRKLPIDYN